MSKNYCQSVMCIEDRKYRDKEYLNSDGGRSKTIYTWGAEDCYSVPEEQ